MNSNFNFILSQYRNIERPYSIQQFFPKNVWLINDKYVLKHIKTRKRVKNICSILQTLKINNSIKLIKTDKSKDYIPRISGYYILYEYISGNTLKIENLLTQCTDVGKSIAELHKLFSKIKTKNFKNPNLMKEYDKAISFILKKGFNIPNRILKECENFRQVYKFLPKQLIHRDIKIENLINSINNDIFFIDFDSCEFNIRIFDIAYFAVTLLDTDNETFLINKWKKGFDCLIHGYIQKNDLLDIEIFSIRRLVLIIEICFINLSLINQEKNCFAKFVILEETYKLLF